MTDTLLIDDIFEQTEGEDHRLRSLIREIALSPGFQ
ncbi:MAG: hypothetical protein ISQ06_12025 [Planctomycetaceae bacterium]|nr:hypothetical protein [Planctomycetaceae bacterium]